MIQGDLQELLGQVPTYTSPIEERSPTGLPHLPNDSEHAYHLVVMYAIFSFLISFGLSDLYPSAPDKSAQVFRASHSASAQALSWEVEIRRRRKIKSVTKTRMETVTTTSKSPQSHSSRYAVQSLSSMTMSMSRTHLAGRPSSKTSSFMGCPLSGPAHARRIRVRIMSWGAHIRSATSDVARNRGQEAHTKCL